MLRVFYNCVSVLFLSLFLLLFNTNLFGQCTIPAPPTGPPACPLDLVQYGGLEPVGGGLLAQVWKASAVSGGPGNVISTSFAATECGNANLLGHGNNSDATVENFPFFGVGDQGDAPGKDLLGLDNAGEQVQLDGWLLVPGCFDEINFRISGGGIHEGAFFAGADVASMVPVVSDDGGLAPATTATAFSLAGTMEITAEPGCTYKILRIRIIHTDGAAFGTTRVAWNLGNGFEDIPDNYGYPVAMECDDTPPTNVSFRIRDCKFAYQDSNGDLFTRNANGSAGTGIALNPIFCEKVGGTVKSSIDVPATCPAAFTCDVVPVKVEFSEPDGLGEMFVQGWVGNSYDASNNRQEPYTAAFSNVEDGLPAHTVDPEFSQIYGLMGAGVLDDGYGGPFNGNANAEQYIVDGWLAVPPNLSCLTLYVGNSNRAQASGVFAGPDYDGLAFVASETNGRLTAGGISIPESAMVFGCGYQWMRIRVYHHDEFSFSDSRLGWDVGNGRESIPANFIFPADNPTDNTPPTGVTISPVSTVYGLMDELGNVWQANGDNIPTRSIDLCDDFSQCAAITDISDCTGMVAPTSGPDCAATLAADPCQIEVVEEGCNCLETDNVFSNPANPRTVTQYQQKAYVNYNSDALGILAFTAENVVGTTIESITVNTDDGNTVCITYKATPGTPYSFDITSSSGIVIPLNGLCGMPDECNCPSMDEICGDGIDNDFDGLIDAADKNGVNDIGEPNNGPTGAADCILDCNTTPIEIQGKMPLLDGKVTTSIWFPNEAQFSASPANNPSPVNEVSMSLRPVTPFQIPAGGGLPVYVGAGSPTIDNTSLTSLGVRDKTPATFALGFRGGSSDVAQQDAWVVFPPDVTCVDLKVNNPARYDATALYLGDDYADLSFVGESFGVRRKMYNPSQIVTHDLSTAPTFGTCGWKYQRARIYLYDSKAFIDGTVQWNIGNGFENIPSKFLMSVGTSPDSDGNRPAAEMLTAPYCAFQDSNGDIFLANGDFYTLSTRLCETVVNDACISCPSDLAVCKNENDCPEPILDDVGNPFKEEPECFLEVLELTPYEVQLDNGGMFTQVWDANDGNGFGRSGLNTSIINAFDDYSAGACPDCLPKHPNTATGNYVSTRLGVVRTEITAGDTDGDEFSPNRWGTRGAENAQQDGWLLVPVDVECIKLILGGQGTGAAYDASRLYLGESVDNMTFVGENINERGRNDLDTFIYDIPATAPTVASDCEFPIKAIRARLYHHDNGAFANTVVSWDYGKGFEEIPTEYLRPVTDECDDTPPSKNEVTFVAQTPIKIVRSSDGRYLDYSQFPASQPTDCDYSGFAIDVVDPKDCYDLVPLCGQDSESANDPKGVCSACRKPYPQISDPCVCLDNGGVGVGQFAETVKVTSIPGETWTVKSVSGFYLPPSGAFPPAMGGTLYPQTLIPIGTTLTEMPMAGNVSMYLINGIHVDDIGFSITVTNGTTDLTIGNKCTDCNTDPKEFTGDVSGVFNGDGITFFDDGTNDGNYGDEINRRIFTFCPDNPAKESIKLNFTGFNIAPGDTFRIYTGSHIFSNNYLDITGNSVGSMNPTPGVGDNVPDGGVGWVSAPCSNPSGCLSILWAPNGDNIKGAGWQLETQMIDHTPEMGACTIENYSVDCNTGELSIGDVEVPEVTLKNSCGVEDSSFYLEYSVDNGAVLRDMATQNSVRIDELLRIGPHLLRFQLKHVGADGLTGTADDSVCITRECVFAITSPTLPVCNDNLIIPLGAGCSTFITPDALLEGPDLVNNTYKINIESAEGGKNASEHVVDNNTDEVIIVRPGIYNYEIQDGCGQKCSGVLTIKDTYKPTFGNLNNIDTIVACVTELTEDGLGLEKPSVVDNCGTPIVTFISANFISGGDVCSDTSRIEIVWSAVDSAGNDNTATQNIVLIRPATDKLVFPNNVLFECSDDKSIVEDLTLTGTPGLEVGEIKNGIFTPSDTTYLDMENYKCGYILQKRDVKIPEDGCVEKHFRYWDLLDWCDSENGPIRIDTQIIKFVDTLAPEIQGEIGDTVLPTIDLELGAFSCTYDVTKLETPTAIDNCDSDPVVRLDRVRRIEDGGYWTIDESDWTTLDQDSFELRWIAEDHCKEQDKNDTTYQVALVKDVTLPAVIAQDELHISMASSSSKAVRIHVDDIDQSSSDVCGIKSRHIRIKDSNDPWDTIVYIACEYIHLDLEIELSITDNGGLVNTGWTKVKIEDKINPTCTFEDETAFCDEYHRDEFGIETDSDKDNGFDEEEYLQITGDLLNFYNSNFGYPSCDDNLSVNDGCGALDTIQEYQHIVSDCGEAKIRRRVKVIDWSKNESSWAVQNITINYRPNWKVTLPSDWEGTCEEVAPEATILVENGTCDLVQVESEDKLFQIPGACKAIERTYHIINWCKYEAGSLPERIDRIENPVKFAESQIVSSEGRENLGYFTYTQILKIQDNEAPVVTVTDPEPCIDMAIDYGCEQEKTWTATVSDDCSDQEDISWVGKLFDASGNVLKEVTTNEIKFSVENKQTLTAEFWAYDGCGNSEGVKGQTIKFWDCMKPVIYLIHGLAGELNQAGEFEIWAKDFDKGSYDNCTPQNALNQFIWHATFGETPSNIEEVLALPSNLKFTCTEKGNQKVRIYVVDEEHNYDFAESYVLVQDNMIACSNIESQGSDMVAGRILNVNGENIESVEIAVNGNTKNSMMTNESGTYRFLLPNNGDYTITPSKNINPLEGVSTFDLVLISKHILGISTFDTPYKYIAADVNKSGTITAFDMVQLRQLILNIVDDLPQNNSWRFVSSDYEFMTENPASEDFKEFVSINNLTEELEGVDFRGIKIGDINGSILANNLVESGTRNNQAFKLQVVDQYLNLGETIEVAFNADDLPQIEGFQFTLNFSDLAFDNLIEGILKTENFNTKIAEKGILTSSWNGNVGVENTLFSLNFTAQSSGYLSDLMSISNAVTKAEAYDHSGNLLNVGLEFISSEQSDKFELFQNTPNPFKGKTVIGFNLPKAGKASLKIMDIRGAILTTVHGDFSKGYNQFEVDMATIGSIGINYYQLESSEHIAVKKMIILE